MGVQQLGMFEEEITQVTKVADNGCDRVGVNLHHNEVQPGQKVMFDRNKSELKQGIVKRAEGKEIDVQLLNGKLLKNHKCSYYPLEKDLKIAKVYREAKHFLDNEQYDQITGYKRSVLLDNASFEILARIDNVNNKNRILGRKNDIISFGEFHERELERDFLDALPKDMHYNIIKGQIEEFEHSIGDEVIVERYNRVYIGHVKRQEPRGSYTVMSDYHYKDGEKIDRSEMIPCTDRNMRKFSVFELEKALD